MSAASSRARLAARLDGREGVARADAATGVGGSPAAGRARPGGRRGEVEAGGGRGRLDLLYDIYGGLLTDNQRRIFRLRHHLDLSLAEIAAQEKVSRQAVHDVLQRTQRVLTEAEGRLGLARRYLAQRRLVEEARRRLRELMEQGARLRVPELAQGLHRVDRALEALLRKL